MSTPMQICAFYSKGPHYATLLDYLREEFPDAEITALVPAGYVPSEAVRNAATRVRDTGQTRYSPLDLKASWRLVRLIRSVRYDLFVVMFDSAQLRMLCALSNARARACYTVEGRYIPAGAPPSRVLFRALSTLMWGHLVFAGVWLAVHLSSARPRLQLRRIARERLRRDQ